MPHVSKQRGDDEENDGMDYPLYASRETAERAVKELGKSGELKEVLA